MSSKHDHLGTYVTRYKNMAIYRSEDGYSACNGPDFAADNEPTLEDAKASIDAYWEETQFGEANGFFND